ncbi:hypothetical protein ACHAWX_000403 [Stephanocyclus meneghinianus]
MLVLYTKLGLCTVQSNIIDASVHVKLQPDEQILLISLLAFNAAQIWIFPSTAIIIWNAMGCNNPIWIIVFLLARRS